MRRVLVGKRNDKRVINWPGVLQAGLIVGAVSGASGAATWYLLTGEFNPLAVLFPVAAALGWFLGTGIRTAVSTPVEQLPDLG
jgi:hypothetical protein